MIFSKNPILNQFTTRSLFKQEAEEQKRFIRALSPTIADYWRLAQECAYIEEEAQNKAQKSIDRLNERIDTRVVELIEEITGAVLDIDNRPTCGTKSMHKVIDSAFYSLDKPVCDIKPGDVFRAIKFDFYSKTLKFDHDEIITKIEKTSIFWQSINMDKPKPMTYATLSDCVQRLKTAMIGSGNRLFYKK